MSNRKKMNKPMDRAAYKELDRAAHFARTIGRPLNAMLTVHPNLMNPPPSKELDELFSGIRKRITTWMTRQGHEAVLLWAREKFEGDGREHLHVLLNCPKRLQSDFEQAVRRWCPGEPNAIDLRAADRNAVEYIAKHCQHQARWSRHGRWRRRQTHCPDTGEEVADVLGKRCGTSLNIGATARKAWEASSARSERRQSPTNYECASHTLNAGRRVIP